MPDGTAEYGEFDRRLKRLLSVRPPLDVQKVATVARTCDFASANALAARISDDIWRDVAFESIAQIQVRSDVPKAIATLQRVGFVFLRLLALAEIATKLVVEARVGSGKPGYAMVVPPQVQAYEAGRRPPPTLTPAQVAKRFADARLLLTEANRLLPLIKSPELRQIAYQNLAEAFAQAHGFADAKRMNAAITLPADRLYSLSVLGNELLETGDTTGAKSAARRAQAIATTLPKTASRAVEHRLIFKVFLNTGDPLNAYAVAARMREPYDRAGSLLMLAAVLAHAGGKSEAKRLITEARTQLPLIGDGVTRDRFHEYLVYALIELPDFAEATRTATQILYGTSRERAEKAIADARRKT